MTVIAGRLRRAVDKVVAQVSNLLYRSASSLRMPRQTRLETLETYVAPTGPNLSIALGGEAGFMRRLLDLEFRNYCFLMYSSHFVALRPSVKIPAPRY